MLTKEQMDAHRLWLETRFSDAPQGARLVARSTNLAGVDLAGANLVWADFTGSNFTGANLAGADLSGAALTSANLTSADLTGVDLSDADLSWANLAGADLALADLSWADLTRADLTGANLADAYLSWANLTNTDLVSADLTDADLTGANLAGANLRDADFAGANLAWANLDDIKADIYLILDAAPIEVPGLLDTLRQGKIEGTAYEGDCACLVGTIANLRSVPYDTMPLIAPDRRRPAERWFLAINAGETPKNNPIAKITEGWILEWIASHPTNPER